MNIFSKAVSVIKGMTIQQAKAEYLADNPSIAQALGSNDVAVSGLPDKYNDVPYCTVINDKWVHTVGEYKAECAKTEWNL